ncbi:MAG TPA: ABC transporter permease [Candidatus Merdiplasma excrementigallinarum]|uniref:ABC transporter permease n=1 Tax=Candidatus Merdiplasma excrementigallinarum TaxID=2840864 RepID=A0A9D1P0Y2_9FIRM|nr:ABC transporter permease [Candidatus Merdiplasma excrementigallinarum]
MSSKETQKNNFLGWLARQWKGNSLFSIGLVLIFMIILQTFALNYSACTSFGECFELWIRNFTNVLRNNAGIGIISLGMAFVIISGGIDLAVGSTLVAVGAVMMVLMDTGAGGILAAVGITGLPAYIIAIAAGIIVGLLLGGFTGSLASWGMIPPFIVTLGTQKIFRSVTQHFMQSANPAVPGPFCDLANAQIGGYMLLPIIYWIILAVILYIVSKRTVFGRQVYAVGSNERTAKLSGVNVNLVKCKVYILMGLLVSLTAVLTIARIGSMDYANAGSGYELDAIASVVVGGTSFSGGRGTIQGTVMGVMTIAIMNNLLNLWGVPPFLREAFKGAIIIIAVLLQKKDRS